MVIVSLKDSVLSPSASVTVGLCRLEFSINEAVVVPVSQLAAQGNMELLQQQQQQHHQPTS